MPFMLYTTNTDTPGYIGALGTRLGALGVNIATFALGRAEKGGEAIALMGVDEPLAPEVLAEIAALPQVRQAKALAYLIPTLLDPDSRRGFPSDRRHDLRWRTGGGSSWRLRSG